MPEIFPYQEAAYRQLRATAETFFRGWWKDLPLRPRFNRLVVGPTGTGKTHIARQLAEDLAVPYFEVCITNWIPMGAAERGARPTWLDIADFCHANQQGILCVDELDKCGQSSPWMTYLRVEVFSLLDKRFPGNLDWRPRGDDDFEDCDKKIRASVEQRLRDCFLVIAAGAFQNLWRARRAPVGFHSRPAAPFDTITHRAMGEVVPAEILNRFVPPVIAIKPLSKDDYRAILGSLCRRLPKAKRSQLRALAARSIDDAVADQLGARWAEKLLLELATRSRRGPRQTWVAATMAAKLRRAEKSPDATQSPS